MARHDLLSIAALLAIFGCTPPTDDKDPTDESTDVTDPTDTDPPVGDCVLTHDGTITADETWCAGTHRLTGDVYVEGARLTIDAGAEIVADAGVGLYISYYGEPAALTAVGTVDRPILFRGAFEEAGVWSGVAFYDAARNSENDLTNVIIRNAGGDFLDGALHIEDAEVRLDGVELADAEGAGLIIEGEGALRAGSAAILLTDNDVAATVVATAIGTLPFDTLSGVGNADNRIEVEPAQITQAVRWDRSLPYVFRDDQYFEGTGSPATLTLGPGVTLEFAAGTGLYFGYYGGSAGFVTEGTAADPVVLRSAVGDDRGAWSGVGLYDNVLDASLAYTEIHHAGGAFLHAALQLEACEASLDHVTITHAEENGFVLDNDATFAEGSVGLVVSSSDQSGQSWAQGAASVPSVMSAYVGNDADQILVKGGQITTSGTWAAIGVPWVIDNDVYLEGPGARAAVLTVAAGNTVRFASNAGLYVSYYGGPGGLIADGTEASPIAFTGPPGQDAGSWSGIGFYDNAADSSCRLSWVDVGFGGGAFLHGNVQVESARPTLSHVHLHDSEEYGLYLDDGGSADMTEVSFADNADGDVRNP